MINYTLTHLPVAQEDTPILLSSLAQLEFMREQLARTHTRAHTLTPLAALYIGSRAGFKQHKLFFYIQDVLQLQ